jgi:predicted nucleic acid-binding protein
VTVILDTSAAVELVMARPAQQKVAMIVQKSYWVLAPSLFIYEVANVMWKYHRLLELKSKELETRLHQAIEIIDEYLQAEDLCQEAFGLSCKIGQPVYDAVYLAAARRRKAAILSLDRRIIGAAERLGIENAVV